MQGLSCVDGETIPDNLKLQLADLDGNQQAYEKIVGFFKVICWLIWLLTDKDEITPQNGMFITSYKRFLENFDYAYLNWKTTTPISNQTPNSQTGVEQLLFNNSYVLHRKDQFVVSNNFRFVSLGSITTWIL